MLSKLSLGINALLIIAVAFLFFKMSKLSTPNTAELLPANSAFTSPDGPKGAVLAYVDGDSLNAKYQFIIDKTKSLEANYNAAELKVRKEYEKRQKDVQDIMTYAQNNKVSDEEAALYEERLQQLQYEMQQIEQQQSESVMKKEQQLQLELMERVSKFMEGYAKSKGIDYVVNYQRNTNFILYGNNAYDVTAEVIALLNAEYEKEKAAGGK
ncbi:MAG: OmpH family outer membrane protein [Flavobacteriales bacterium]